MTFLSMMVLCFALGWPALARAQGNPWNNPVVSPRVGTGGGSDFFGQCPFCFTGGAFGAVYGRYMPDAERN